MVSSISENTLILQDRTKQPFIQKIIDDNFEPYIIGKGENLTKIVRKIYGVSTPREIDIRIQAIARDNLISNPNLVMPGRVLLLRNPFFYGDFLDDRSQPSWRGAVNSIEPHIFDVEPAWHPELTAFGAGITAGSLGDGLVKSALDLSQAIDRAYYDYTSARVRNPANAKRLYNRIYRPAVIAARKRFHRSNFGFMRNSDLLSRGRKLNSLRGYGARASQSMKLHLAGRGAWKSPFATRLKVLRGLSRLASPLPILGMGVTTYGACHAIRYGHVDEDFRTQNEIFLRESMGLFFATAAGLLVAAFAVPGLGAVLLITAAGIIAYHGGKGLGSTMYRNLPAFQSADFVEYWDLNSNCKKVLDFGRSPAQAVNGVFSGWVPGE